MAATRIGCLVFSGTRSDKLFGVLQRLGRKPLSREHPAYLTCPQIAGQLFDTCDGSAPRFPFLHHEMGIGESGNLRQVSYAEDLVGARQQLQSSAYSFGCGAPNSCVHFIEYEDATAG